MKGGDGGVGNAAEAGDGGAQLRVLRHTANEVVCEALAGAVGEGAGEDHDQVECILEGRKLRLALVPNDVELLFDVFGIGESILGVKSMETLSSVVGRLSSECSSQLNRKYQIALSDHPNFVS